MRQLTAWCTLGMVAVLLGGPAVGLAGTLDNARLALHAKAPSKSLPTCSFAGYPSNDPNQEGLPCSAYTVAYPTKTAVNMYLVVARAGDVGVKGVSFGVDYNSSNLTMYNWILCTDGIDFKSDGFPAPMTGNRVTWASCQNTMIPPDSGHAVVGAFYAEARREAVFDIIPHPALLSGPELLVTDCSNSGTDLLYITDPEDVPFLTGAVHFGGNGSQGYTPCIAQVGIWSPPVEPTTFGRIKALYR